MRPCRTAGLPGGSDLPLPLLLTTGLGQMLSLWFLVWKRTRRGHVCHHTDKPDPPSPPSLISALQGGDGGTQAGGFWGAPARSAVLLAATRGQQWLGCGAGGLPALGEHLWGWGCPDKSYLQPLSAVQGAFFWGLGGFPVGLSLRPRTALLSPAPV